MVSFGRGWLRAFALICVLLGLPSSNALALGKAPILQLDKPDAAGLKLVGQAGAAPLYIDQSDYAGVARAAANLQADIERVSGQKPALLREAAVKGSDVVLIGTLGKSSLIDKLVNDGKLDVATLRGKWEGYLIQQIEAPMPGVARALVIAGSDKRGTIYGIYELSEQMGVSPWTWWADVPAAQHATIVVPSATRVQDAPVVRYRGIFLNDEAPALTGWAKERFGGLNHQFYEHVFELLLRLRGNYLWPAMWDNAFFDDDKENGRLADEMGIVIGTSHHEPMMRAQQEWKRYGSGPWDYTANGEQLRRFWAGGLDARRDWEKVITLGMRGDGDMPMSQQANTSLLERIVADQRGLIKRELGREPEQVPQLWALYKEVQEYYEQGMRVPDDVTLLWCDDNWGNIRRLPTPEERKRAGGAGIYYHFDYVGGPRSYKWINVTPIPKIWEQMHLAWRYQADRLWIVNVGDLKPMEVPIEFFLTYAWNPEAWPASRLPDYLRLWAAREFGPQYAVEIADMVAKYTQFNGRRKPEQLSPTTYSLANYDEAERIVAEYNALAESAIAMSAKLPANRRDAFYQLVLYPVWAAATVNDMVVSAQRNRLYASEGRASTNAMAERVRTLFKLDAELARRYHEDISGGKWNHMMSQTHIGYTKWSDPPQNIMPEVKTIEVPKKADMGIAAGMAALDVFEKRPRHIELYNRGSAPLAFTITASAPWLVLSKTAGTVATDVRIGIDVRWNQVPPGTTKAELTVSVPGQADAKVVVPISYPVSAASVKGHVETQGVVSIEAAQFSRAVAPAGREWLVIPGHGRTQAGVTTMPATAAALTLADGMRLEYPIHLFSAGKMKVHLTLAPTLKFQPGEGFRYAVSIDDEAPQIVNVHADQSERHWASIVSDGAAEFITQHTVKSPGAHVLKLWALDPGLVAHKLVIDAGGLKPSYLGPPPSPFIASNQETAP